MALPNVEQCLAGGPPADVRDLVEGLRAQIVADIDDALRTPPSQVGCAVSPVS